MQILRLFKNTKVFVQNLIKGDKGNRDLQNETEEFFFQHNEGEFRPYQRDKGRGDLSH